MVLGEAVLVIEYLAVSYRRIAAGAERVRFSVVAQICGGSDGVIGYHARKDLWDARIGEELHCQSEHGNAQDALFNGSLDLERLIQPLSILLASLRTFRLQVRARITSD